MKFRRMIFLFIIAIVAVAWFTKPGLDDFRKFYARELESDQPPVIDFTDRFLYSSVNINFFIPARIEPREEMKAVSVKKEEYLGLFGRFWKL